MHLNANHFLGYDKDEKGNLVINEAQAAFPEKAQLTEHGALHGRAALHLQGNMRQVRRGLLAADMDAGSRKIRVWQCGKRYQQKGVVGCKSGNLYEKDLEKAFLMAWNGIVENRESFLPAWKKQITEGNAIEKWRAGQMVQFTAEPPLETICPKIVNTVLESVEVHDGGLLHFHFLDGTMLEIETEE